MPNLVKNCILYLTSILEIIEKTYNKIYTFFLLIVSVQKRGQKEPIIQGSEARSTGAELQASAEIRQLFSLDFLNNHLFVFN